MKHFFYLIAFYFFSSFTFAYADAVTLDNPIGVADDLYMFIQKVLEIVAQIAFPVVVLMVIYSGFLYIKAQGNSTEIEKAHTAITWTLVGAAVVLGAWVLAEALSGTINQLK